MVTICWAWGAPDLEGIPLWWEPKNPLPAEVKLLKNKELGGARRSPF